MTYEDFKSTNLAFASKAFRNAGIKAPITVMFECFTPANMSVHQRMVSRGLGGNLTNRMTALLNFTEDNFNSDFGQFGFNADDISGGYSDAVEVNVSTSQLYGEDLILRRVDTTDEGIVKNADGSIKPQWSVKTVNGQELTFDGALIYTTVEFAEPGMSNATIKQDQNLSRSITSMSTGASIGDIKENKAKAIAAEVEAAF
jgi:hypothetical protein